VQFQCSSSAVLNSIPYPLQSSSSAVLEQFQRSSCAVPVLFQFSSSAVLDSMPNPQQSSSSAVPEQF